jgi:hypothetical protein
MHITEMVNALTAEREQIDIVLTALHKISTLATANRQALTIPASTGTGIALAQPAARTHGRTATGRISTRNASLPAIGVRRVISAEQREKMSRQAKARWAKQKASTKRAAAKVAKQPVTTEAQPVPKAA